MKKTKHKVIISQVLICLGILLIGFSVTGCSRKANTAMGSLDKQSVQTVKEELSVFESGDISMITESVFGRVTDSTTSSDGTEGIIADLFSNAEVEVTAVEDSRITYTIISPDISDFFQVYADKLSSIGTSEELGQLLLEYAHKAPQKEQEVSLVYTITEEGIDVSYDNPEFINAMTGGLLEAYYDIYTQYLTEEN